MNRETIFIEIPQKLRKQLELPEDRSKFTFYEVLGLPVSFDPDELHKSLLHRRLLLDRLKYNPTYKEMAAETLKSLELAAETLRKSDSRIEYDKILKEATEERIKSGREEYLDLIKPTLVENKLSKEQKKGLIEYAGTYGLSRDQGWSLLNKFSESERPAPVPIASPPELAAPLQAYEQSPAYRMLHEKNKPLLEEMKRLKCSYCGFENSKTHLFCRCGALLRGKMICMDCRIVFPGPAAECPVCEKESKFILPLPDKDIGPALEYIQKLMELEEYDKAGTALKDILKTRPEKQEFKEVKKKLDAILEEKSRQKEIQRLIESAKEDIGKSDYRQARKKLVEVYSSGTCSLDDRYLLDEVHERIKSTGRKKALTFLIPAIIFILGGVGAFIFSGEELIWAKIGIVVIALGLLLLLVSTGYFIVVFADNGKYKKLLKKSDSSGSSEV